MIWEAQAGRGEATTMLCSEYGPPYYQQQLPYTQAPTADLEAICDWQAHREARLFAEKFGSQSG